jgi:hypothetical protein
MNDETLRAFLTLLMCSDPWPVEGEPENQKLIESWADLEAEKHGFKDWIEAYHKL